MGRELNEAEVLPDAMDQVRAWMDEAQGAGAVLPTAMTLATVDPAGHPAARTVLLKGLDAGFVFFTNLKSPKANDLSAHPWGAVVLHWRELERQIRATGPVAPCGQEESASYFASRPRGSQLGAWASPQSQVIGSRAELDQRVEDVAARYGDGPIPLPPWWGGLRLRPETVELWQGRPDRLHDRLRYRRSPSGWSMERLAP